MKNQYDKPKASSMTEQTETKFPRFLFFCRVAAWSYFLFTLYALFIPRPFGKAEIPAFSIIHALAFAVLGFLFELARGRFSLKVSCFLLLAYGPLSEIIQPLTGRYFDWIDILEDTIGVILGIGLAWLLKFCLERRRTKRTPLSSPGDSASG